MSPLLELHMVFHNRVFTFPCYTTPNRLFKLSPLCQHRGTLLIVRGALLSIYVLPDIPCSWWQSLHVDPDY